MGVKERAGAVTSAVRGVSSRASPFAQRLHAFVVTLGFEVLANSIKDSSVQGGLDGSNSVAEGLGRGSLESVSLGESNVLVRVLDALSTTKLRVVENAGSDDLDRVSSSAMTTRHLHVHL